MHQIVLLKDSRTYPATCGKISSNSSPIYLYELSERSTTIFLSFFQANAVLLNRCWRMLSSLVKNFPSNCRNQKLWHWYTDIGTVRRIREKASEYEICNSSFTSRNLFFFTNSIFYAQEFRGWVEFDWNRIFSSLCSI